MPEVGPYTLHRIDAGRFALDGGAMFGIVPKPLWSKRIAPDDRNRIPLQMRCLLLEGNGRVILIDNGLGDKYDSKFADIYAINQNDADLYGSLESAGFSKDDVTDVILTHLHFDHCGGSTRREGDRYRPSFPQATYYLQERHWRSAHEPNVKERGSFFSENFDPLEATGQLQLIDGDQELFDDVHVFTAEGHTEGQQLVRVEGPERTVVFAADLLPTSAHLAPAWVMGFDIRPLVTIDEKGRFLDHAFRNDWAIYFEHDPDVEVADLREGPKGIEIANPRALSEL